MGLVKFLLNFFIFRYVVGELQSYDQFEKSCQIPIDGFLFCSFTVYENWDLREFRKWTDALNVSIKQAEVYIKCQDGASVFLPWPVRARQLQVLDIKNCVIRGFYSEYNKPANYSDNLIDLKLEDCEIADDMNATELTNGKKLASKSFVCGQESIVVIDTRNVTYPSSKNINPLTMKGSSKEADISNSEIACTYEHLIYFEESLQFQQEKIMVNSYYPSLRAINLTSNNLSSVPKRLQKWPSYFPALEVIDLSFNNIRKFSHFEDSKTNDTLYIDFRDNSIREIPSNITKYLEGNAKIIFDLRNNPVLCDCNALNLKQYLQSVKQLYPVWDHCIEVKCASPTNIKGKLLMDVLEKNLCPDE